MPAPETVLLLGLACILAVALGALRFNRRQSAGQGLPPAVPASLSVGRSELGPGWRVPQRICTVFHAWLADAGEGPEVWASFDQLVRETLTEHLGALRVRCFNVQPGQDTLQPIRQTDKPAPPAGPSAREGLLGHVATTGKEYAAGDPTHGPLLDDLASQSADPWTWVWPVRRRTARGASTIGLIAVGELRDPAALSPEARRTIGPLLSLWWLHVAALARLHVVQRTDQASGVLTRNDFFAVAERSLTNSYGGNEPVVVAVLALEGLRRLDDTRCWRERDALIVRLGQLIAARVRSDDVVGRFADDRFVVLLRRLDSGLGRLIAEKMLAAARTCIAQLGALEGRINLRMGLAGSGFAQPPLSSLLAAAFDAVERARKENVALAADAVRADEAPRAAMANFAGPDECGDAPTAGTVADPSSRSPATAAGPAPRASDEEARS